jgi:O-antigen/teichoic acid export membrane protein
MDQGVRRRLLLAFISNFISKLGGTLIQLIQVPVFLHFWSTPLYGEWLIVTAIPAYLSFATTGFASVAANDMTMWYANGDRARALAVFQSCGLLILLACALIIALLALILIALPDGYGFGLLNIGAADTRWIVFFLGCSVLLGQIEQLFQAAYASVGKYALGGILKTGMSILAFAIMIAAVVAGGKPRSVALAFAIGNAVGTVLLGWLVRRQVPWIELGWRHARLAEVRRLAAPALAFMSFPLGNAVNLQGTLLVIGYVLGAGDVVVFGTARTVSRIALQIVLMVNFSFWPEFSTAYGQGDKALVRTLHRRACQMALAIAVVVVIGVEILGPSFLHHWTDGQVPPSRPLLTILLACVVLNSLWSTSSTLVAAINQHQDLARAFMFATVLSVLLTFPLAEQFGLDGAAFALLFCEAIMNLNVLPNSLRLAEDSMKPFLGSLFDMPQTGIAARLMQRVKQASHPRNE